MKKGEKWSRSVVYPYNVNIVKLCPKKYSLFAYGISIWLRHAAIRIDSSNRNCQEPIHLAAGWDQNHFWMMISLQYEVKIYNMRYLWSKSYDMKYSIVTVLCASVAGVCLFSGKDRKTHIRYVCRVWCWKCGWCVLFSLHANYAGITTCGLFAQCSNCIQFVCWECKLADFRRTRARAGDLASCAADTRCALDSLADLNIFIRWCLLLLINQSSSTYM